MLKHKIGLIVAALLVAGLAQASDSIQWQFHSDSNTTDYNPNGFTVTGTEVSCQVSPVEIMLPGEKHNLVCWYNTSKKIIVNRTLHCDRNQIEDYIEVEDFYLGCKSR